MNLFSVWYRDVKSGMTSEAHLSVFYYFFFFCLLSLSLSHNCSRAKARTPSLHSQRATRASSSSAARRPTPLHRRGWPCSQASSFVWSPGSRVTAASPELVRGGGPPELGHSAGSLGSYTAAASLELRLDDAPHPLGARARRWPLKLASSGGSPSSHVAADPSAPLLRQPPLRALSSSFSPASRLVPPRANSVRFSGTGATSMLWEYS